MHRLLTHLRVRTQVHSLATSSPGQTFDEQPHSTNTSASSDLFSGDCGKQTIDCPTTHLPFEEQATRVTDTLDVIQKTHRCSLQEAIVWRDILSFRYNFLQILDRGITLQIQHFSDNTPILDRHDADTSLFVLTTCSAEIAKTTIRLYEDSNKLITVTLYFKHKDKTGTLTTQGVMVPGWSETEFRHLHSLITAIVSTAPSTLQDTQGQLMTTMISAPVPFLGTWFDTTKPRQRVPKRQIAKKDQAIVQQILADDNCGVAHHKVSTVSL